MMTRLRLNNFKPWRDTGPVRLAPVTVLFGENSSGKSSLLQAMLLLRQTLDKRSPEPLYLGGGRDDRVDLGSAEALVNKTAPGGPLSLAFEWEQRKDPSHPLPDRVKHWDTLAFEVTLALEDRAFVVESLRYANASCPTDEYVVAARIKEKGSDHGKYSLNGKPPLSGRKRVGRSRRFTGYQGCGADRCDAGCIGRLRL